MSEQQNSLQIIFVEALEIEDAQQRAAFLFQACGTDSALRREVEELIQAHAAAGNFLPEQPAVIQPAASNFVVAYGNFGFNSPRERGYPDSRIRS
jgi:hypothetical protein